MAKKETSTYRKTFFLLFPSNGISKKFNGITTQFDFVVRESSVGTVTQNDLLQHKAKLKIVTHGINQGKIIHPLDTTITSLVWSKLVEYFRLHMDKTYVDELHFAGYLRVLPQPGIASVPGVVFKATYGKELLCYLTTMSFAKKDGKKLKFTKL